MKVRSRLPLLVVSLLTLSARAQAPATADGIARIEQADFKRALAAHAVVVIDVRNEQAYIAGHIPGARLWDPAAFERQVAELKAAKRAIVTYCT